MHIPREFIRDLIDRANLVDIVGAHVKLERRAGRWFGLCPFHKEKTPSFAVHAEKGFYHCFGCGEHGDALAFFIYLNGGDFIAGVEALAAELGVRVPREGAAHGEDAGLDVGGVLRATLNHWREQLRRSPEASAYLKKRGIDEETAERYELGYAGKEWDELLKTLSSSFDEQLLIASGVIHKSKEKGRLFDYFRGRLMFPIVETNNRICGFGGRVLSDARNAPYEEPKYLNSAENARFSKRRILYGLPQAMDAARQKKRMLICEGYMDVVALAQNGFGEAVATMGTAATAEQMKKAARLAPHIVFAYDADAAGQKGAQRALEGILPALKDGVSAAFLFLPEGEDPDSYIRKNGAEAFEERIREARPLAEYIATTLWENFAGASGSAAASSADQDGRRTAVMKEGERLTRLLSARDAPYWRQLLTERLAQRAGMSAAPLRQAVARPPANKARATGVQSALRTGSPSRRMRPESKLFMLLCFLSAAPELINRFEQADGNIPLPGGAEESAIVADVLSKLRWNMQEEPPNVAELLEAEGYPALARQVQDSVGRRFAATTDIAAEFDALLDRLKESHRRATGAGKQDWLDKLTPAPPAASKGPN